MKTTTKLLLCILVFAPSLKSMEKPLDSRLKKIVEEYKGKNTAQTAHEENQALKEYIALNAQLNKEKEKLADGYAYCHRKFIGSSRWQFGPSSEEILGKTICKDQADRLWRQVNAELIKKQTVAHMKAFGCIDPENAGLNHQSRLGALLQAGSEQQEEARQKKAAEDRNNQKNIVSRFFTWLKS